MAFITGLFLIDAPASALNNGESDNIKAKVKSIYVHGQGAYPYASAQAFRYWLRTGLERQDAEWKANASPIYNAGKGAKQQAYTAGDPIKYWDDDLLGYMRAEKNETVTRVSPFRNSTLVSIAPVQIVDDFGVMARVPKEEGDKEGVLLFQHEFYRATLQGLFSLDLASVGTFANRLKSGFQNLGKAEMQTAQSDLEHLEDQNAYRLPTEERIKRVQSLLGGIAALEGGAKQALHYTDVSPLFSIMAVTRGGNHAFGRVVSTKNSAPVVHKSALSQALEVFAGDILSPVYVGRAEGFMDDSQATLDELGLKTVHPRQAFAQLAEDLAAHPDWMD